MSRGLASCAVMIETMTSCASVIESTACKNSLVAIYFEPQHFVHWDEMFIYISFLDKL